MPDREYRTTTTTSTSETVSSSLAEEDLQDTVGNEALTELIATQSMSSESDVDTLWEEAAAEQATQKPDLQAGLNYTVQDADLVSGGRNAWRIIARAHGMMEDELMAFNPHIESVRDPNYSGPAFALPEYPDLASGVQIYIPSADDILFKQCAAQSESMAETVELWDELAGGHNLAVIRTARERASGKIGTGYGTPGDEGIFYSPNPDLVGASSKRSEVIDGNTEYRVNWGADFWKCSVFLHDVVYGAGYVPTMTDNDHYQLAGRLQDAPDYEEVSVDKARPGDCWQRFGGSSSDESHNAILSSFVQNENVDEMHDRWVFRIIGAEDQRAAESERSHLMMKDTNENTAGKIIRFFRPKARQSTTGQS
jgi:hypothetical protein